MPPLNTFGPTGIDSYHWVKFNVQNNRVCYVLTGNFIVNFQGSFSDWRRERLTFKVPIPDLPANMGLHIELWAPLFTLNSVFNEQTAINSGYAVESFDLQTRETLPDFGDSIANFYAVVAVREIRAIIHRIGFNITLTGTIKPLHV